MADTGAQLIVFSGIQAGDARADLFYPIQELAAQTAINILSGQGSKEPGGALKQVGVREFHAGLLFAGHGMSGQETLPSGLAQNLGCARHHLGLRTSDVRQKRLRWKSGREALHKIDYRQHWSGEHDYVAAVHGIGW